MADPGLPLIQYHGHEISTGFENLRDDAHLTGERRLCWLTRFDYIYIGILILLLFPAFKLAHLPFQVDYAGIATAFWGGTTVAAAFFAVLFIFIALPIEETLLPFLSRLQAQKGRIPIALLLLASMSWSLGWWLGIMVTTSILGVAELLDRRNKAFRDALFDILIPALYLFVVITLVLAFNHAIAGIRYAGTYDAAFSHLDWVLFHVNVSNIAHWSLSHFPHWLSTLLELTYFGLYGRIGAALVLAALLGNQQYAVKFVRTMLICYSIALLVFLACPVKGPYSICTMHLSSYPRSMPTFWTQEALLEKARALWAHQLTPHMAQISLDDYYVGFPSLHVALPIIAIWFLRPWKLLATILLVLYVTLLLPAVILLEWHYVIDMFGGIAVAFL